MEELYPENHSTKKINADAEPEPCRLFRTICTASPTGHTPKNTEPKVNKKKPAPIQNNLYSEVNRDDIGSIAGMISKACKGHAMMLDLSRSTQEFAISNEPTTLGFGLLTLGNPRAKNNEVFRPTWACGAVGSAHDWQS
jgi:hypothetical protein